MATQKLLQDWKIGTGSRNREVYGTVKMLNYAQRAHQEPKDSPAWGGGTEHAEIPAHTMLPAIYLLAVTEQ